MRRDSTLRLDLPEDLNPRTKGRRQQITWEAMRRAMPKGSPRASAGTARRARISPAKKARRTVGGNAPGKPIGILPGTVRDGRKYLTGQVGAARKSIGAGVNPAVRKRRNRGRGPGGTGSALLEIKGAAGNSMR